MQAATRGFLVRKRHQQRLRYFLKHVRPQLSTYTCHHRYYCSSFICTLLTIYPFETISSILVNYSHRISASDPPFFQKNIITQITWLWNNDIFVIHKLIYKHMSSLVEWKCVATFIAVFIPCVCYQEAAVIKIQAFMRSNWAKQDYRALSEWCLTCLNSRPQTIYKHM